MKTQYWPVFAIAGVFAWGAGMSAGNSAVAGENRVTERRCDQVAVSIGNARDAAKLFDMLPKDSEQVGDSALVRSVLVNSEYDELNIRCALSSGDRARCQLTYSQFSATSDVCSHERSRFSMTGELSRQLVEEVRLKDEMTAFGPMKTYRTRDGVLNVDCGTVMSGMDCALYIR